MSTKATDATRIAIESGTGNVFEDLGLPDAPDRLAKAELARVIRTVVTVNGWTQRQTADVIGIAPPDMSDLMRGKLARFSQERLERFLNALDMDVNIRVTPRPANKARANVSVDLIGFPLTPTRNALTPSVGESRDRATIRALEEISLDLAGLFRFGRDLCARPDEPALAYLIAYTGRELMLGVVRELEDETARSEDELLEPTGALQSAFESRIAEVLKVDRSAAVVRALTDAALSVVRESDVPSKEEADDFRIRIASALSVNPNASLAKQWSVLHRKLQGFTHVRRPDHSSPAVGPLRTAFAELADLLFGSVVSIFETEDEVDRLSALAVPTPTDLDRIKRLVPRAILRRRFFDGLRTAAWLEPLAKAGLFRTVPDRTEFPDKSWSMTPWPEGSYLLRMAPAAPQRVMEIFRETPTANTNPAVWALVADAVATLPPEHAVQLIPLLETALRSAPPVFFPRRVLKAAARLGREGCSEAFALALALAWPTKVPDIVARKDNESIDDFVARIREQRNHFIYNDWWVLARFDRYEFDQFVPVLIPALEHVDRARTLKFLCERLTRTIRQVAITRRVFTETLAEAVKDAKKTEISTLPSETDATDAADNEASFTDAIASGEDERGESRYWCDDLEHYDESDGVRAAFATAAFAVARRLIEGGAEPATVIDSLDSFANEIFRRMQWRLLADQPALIPELRDRMDAFLRSDEALWPTAGGRETTALLRTHFMSASPSAQHTFCSSLESGPGEAWLTRHNEFSERADTPTERAEALIAWQHTRLRWFHDRMPAVLAPIADRLGVVPAVPSTRQQSLDETGSWSSGVFSASARSPMTAEALAALSAHELVQYLATWSPPHGSEDPWEAPTAEGLRTMISAMATEQPAHAIALLPQLTAREIPLGYLSAFVSGLRTAIQQSKSISITELIDFARFVWRRSHREMPHDTPKHRVAEWSAMAVLNLLQATMSADLVAADHIKPLRDFALEMVDATTTWQAASDAVVPATYDAVLQLSTSSPQAQVIETVLDIAWQDFLLNNPGIHWPPPVQTATGAWTVPLLERMLALPEIAGIAAEGAIGSGLGRLLWLAHEWTVSMLPRVLADGATNPAGRPAWAMYVTRSQLFDPMFDVLRPWYATAAAALPVQGEPSGDAKWRVATALTDHVITAAVRGLCTGDDPDQLVPHVFDRVPIKTRTHAYWMVFRGWSDTEAPAAAMSQHVIEFWEWRLAKLESRPSDVSRDEEVDGLCWFIATPHLPPHDVIRLGTRTVALLKAKHRTGGLAWTRLTELAAIDPSATFDIVEKLIVLSLAGEFVYLPFDEVSPSIRAAIAVGGAVRKRARSLLERIGNAGLSEYKDLWVSSQT